MLALPTIAQDDDESELFPPLPLTQSIEVEGEEGDIGTFYYPEGWYSDVDEEYTFFSSVTLSNIPFPEDDPEETINNPVQGQIIVEIVFFTPDLLGVIFGEAEGDQSPEQIIEEFVGDDLLAVDTEVRITSFFTNDRAAALATYSDVYDEETLDIALAVVNIDESAAILFAQSLPGTLSRYTYTLGEMLGALEYIPASNGLAESTAEARNNTPSSGDFVDDSGGILSVDVPDGWTSTTTDDRLILANSAFALQSVLEDGDEPQIGDVLVSVATFPPSFDDSLAEINSDTDVQDTLLSVFSDNQGAFPALQFGALQTIALDESQDATLIDGTFARNGSQFEFAIIMVTMPTTHVVFVAYGDELRPFRDTLLEIAASSVYSP